MIRKTCGQLLAEALKNGKKPDPREMAEAYFRQLTATSKYTSDGRTFVRRGGYVHELDREEK